MMTKKQALAKDGKVPVSMGRGRLSREATARVEELVAMGWDIEGYSRSTPKSTTEPVAVKKVPVTSSEKVVQDFHILYDVDLYEAVTAEGRVFTMKEVCNGCGVSLVQNHCDNPTVLGIPVTIRFK